MDIHGRNIIGSELSAEGTETFRAFDPRTGTALPGEFHEAGSAEIARAAELAAKAAVTLGELGAEKIAAFLDAIREELLALGDELIVEADRETALGVDRLRGERDRTVNQIKMFADLVREGSWIDARIDTPNSARRPVPKPDVRRLLRPIGPVAVFGASNFPLAFSVAGGDTGSAFAAGNPVIVKAHPAHPGTSEMAGNAIQKAAKKNSLPSGTFSLLHGLRSDVSIELVTHPNVKAVAFTGSERAGRALYDAAAQRPEPIPVFSEMGSVNPVFLLPSVFTSEPGKTVEGLYRSVVLGVGQFCTSPGLVFGVDEGNGLRNFATQLREQFEKGVPGTMLNGNIAKGFQRAFEEAAALPGVEATVSVLEPDAGKTEGRPGVLVTDAPTWQEHERLQEEIFGPSTVIVRCRSMAEMLDCARQLEGSLTATIHGLPEEIAAARDLFAVLERKVGRMIFNGYPTGVEVGYAMHHGGPYPATTDARFTSVGTAAIYRFARPVCFQNFPDAALPPELQNANPRGIWRMLDGHLTKEPIAGAQKAAQ